VTDALRPDAAPVDPAAERVTRFAEFVYLRDNPAAQRMAMAWPLVPDHTATGKRLARMWAELADVPPHRAGPLARVLRAHGICRDDGTTERAAIEFIASQVRSTIRLPRAPRTGGRP
jgi:hypothetical protein